MHKKNIDVKELAEVKSVSDFCFSKDDSKIFYISNLGEYYRLWAIPSGGGYPRLVSHIDKGDAKAFKISPDGKNIAFMVDYDGKESPELFIMSAEGGLCKSVSKDVKIAFPFSIPTFSWSPDSNKVAVIIEEEGYYNVAAIDILTTEVEKLTDSIQLKGELDWSPKGEWIAYTVLKEALKIDICLINIKTKDIQNITENISGEHNGPFFSPDGKYIAFTSNSKGSYNVGIFDIAEKTIAWLPKNGCEQKFLKWHLSGNKFAFLKNEEGEMSLFESNFPPSQTKKLSTKGYSGTMMSYSNNDERVALRLTTPKRSSEIYIRKEKTLRKLTDSFAFGVEAESFVMPEKVKYPSFDGLEIPAFYYKPKDKKNYPVIILVHGGPTAQFYYTWYPMAQLFAINGFAVLTPNIRGSSGYGKEFENKVFHDWGGDDLKDLLYGIEYIKKADPNADVGNLSIGGISYGGYMSLMAAMKYPNLWKCAVNVMGPVNLENLYNNSAAWVKPVLKIKYGFKEPNEDKEFYFERSPINFVGNIQCPLLLMYGMNDSRVAFSEMAQLKEKLTENKKEFEEGVFETEGHSMNRVNTRVTLFGRMLDFIKKHTKVDSKESIDGAQETSMDVELPEEISGEEYKAENKVSEVLELAEQPKKEEITETTDSTENKEKDETVDTSETEEINKNVNGGSEPIDEDFKGMEDMQELDEIGELGELEEMDDLSELPQLPEIPDLPLEV